MTKLKKIFGGAGKPGISSGLKGFDSDPGISRELDYGTYQDMYKTIHFTMT